VRSSARNRGATMAMSSRARPRGDVLRNGVLRAGIGERYVIELDPALDAPRVPCKVLVDAPSSLFITSSSRSRRDTASRTMAKRPDRDECREPQVQQQRGVGDDLADLEPVISVQRERMNESRCTVRATIKSGMYRAWIKPSFMAPSR